MRNLKDIILEKLKVTKRTVSDINEHTIEVPFYEFVIWYTGYLNMKPDEITEEEFRSSYFIYALVDSYGNNVFTDAREAYDFYKRYKDDIVTITIEKQKVLNSVSNKFMNNFENIIDFGNEVFYIDSYEDFIK